MLNKSLLSKIKIFIFIRVTSGNLIKNCRLDEMKSDRRKLDDFQIPRKHVYDLKYMKAHKN